MRLPEDPNPSEPTEPYRTGEREHAESAGPPDQAAAPARETIHRGSTIGRYLVLQRLGEGGMGVVYAAYDAELDRKVALKLLRPTGGDSGEGHARLMREAQAMARVSHPNVIAVHDVGTYRDQVFVAMDLVEGTTLSKWLRQEPRPWREVVRVFLDAGRGLKAAHDAGLVHRDFKPTNVLLGRDGRVFVTDFGLARLTSDEDDRPARSLALGPPPALGQQPRRKSRLSSEVTSEGVVMGTPRYMAPEQMRGDRVDARADQFSFCAALYYGLWRQHAFDPDQLAGAAARVQGQPTAPVEGDKARSGGQGPIAEPPSSPRVPSRIRRAVLRGLELEADQRYPSMEPLLEELAFAANPASTRAAYGLAAAVLLMMVGGAVWVGRERARAQVCTGGAAELASTWSPEVAGSVASSFQAAAGEHGVDQARRVQRTLDAYAERWAAAHRDACEATRIRGEQTETILALRMTCLERKRKELAALLNVLGRPDAALVDKSVDAAHGLSGVGQCRDVDALTAVGRPDDPGRRDAVEAAEGRLAQVEALRAAGRYADGLKQARMVLEEAQKLGFRPLEAQARYLAGMLLELTGDLRSGERELDEAMFIAEAGRDEVTKLRVTTRLTYVVGDRMLRPEEGLLWGRLGEATLSRIGADNYPDLEADLWNQVGNVHLRAGSWEKAVTAFQRSYQVVKKASGNELRRVRALSNIATAQSKMGLRTESIASQREAIADMERLRGADHPILVRPLYNIANTLTELGEFKDAHAAVERALQISEAKLGKENPSTADVLDTFGSLLLEEGRSEEALAHYRRALQIKQKMLEPGNALYAFTYDGLGRSLLAMGKSKEAAEWLERAVAVKPGDDTVLADIHFGLARALWASGPQDHARARSLALDAKQSFERLHYARRVAAVSVWLSEPGRN
ncbi:MAG TPA: serine/threonine-protein kinase [Myxococcales bacterium]|nr:serine/threonine-protein kinase [Myxococcales bacterium]